ncbi:hypothetical protein RJT34_19650 [Clitoria ternatea]|uniref:Uncharacterized protein n=1 Tax=Clitoria ternatea TaxID=43366 RepID=A0AAN9IRQ4_CLITE
MQLQRQMMTDSAVSGRKLAKSKLAIAKDQCANLGRCLGAAEESYALVCIARKEVEEKLKGAESDLENVC